MKFWLAAAAILVFANPAPAGEPLELQTQFGKPVPVLGDGQPRIIVYADQEGSSQTATWAKALEAVPCPSVAAANLSAVPEFVRSTVRDSFREEEPIALDWQGRLAGRLGFKADEANVYLVDAAGAPLAHLHGEPADTDLEHLRSLATTDCTSQH